MYRSDKGFYIYIYIYKCAFVSLDQDEVVLI